jgi:hypothetical protein
MNLLRNILKFPGLFIHPSALTENYIIDGYLMELDSHLLGSQKFWK